MSKDIESLLKEKVLVLDGAMGTMLQNKGMNPGDCPEQFGVDHPEILTDIHRQYVEAGSDIIQSNTFGANSYKLSEYNLKNRVKEINAEAIRIARKAAGSRALVAASVGPSGKILKPMGDVEFDELYSAYQEQMVACEQAGADLLSIETMSDIGEMRVALIAARSSTRLPVIAHMTYEAGGRTMMGTDPVTALVIMEALQPLAIGANCSGGAQELLPVIKDLAKYSNSYLSVEPNAGLPRLVGEKTVFPDTAEEMAEYALRLKDAGANIIGGCCGTTPAHIQAMASVLKGMVPVQREQSKYFAFASRTQSLFIGSGHPLALIGERINPTARKKLAQDIKDGKMQVVVDEARKQVEAGAPMLDVNMGVPGIDEVEAMKKAILSVQTALDVPLSIDSTNPDAIEEGLKNFVGRPLINSTTGEDKHLNIVLPLAKKYGAAVLGLCLDEKGIPSTAEGRVEVARKIYQRAREFGLRDEDVFIDTLVKTASAEQSQVMETISALQRVKQELGLPIVLGVSNVSHGLPAREVLNSAYLAMAWAAGLDLPILNPFDERMMDTTRAASVLLNRDKNSTAYINQYRNYKKTSTVRNPICENCNIPDLLNKKPVIDDKTVSEKPEKTEQLDGLLGMINKAILEGDRDNIEDLIIKALNDNKFEVMDIVNQALIPGIEKAGELYDQKRYFLPQLMMAAESMKKAFSLLRPYLAEDGGHESGVVIIATVEGDIHDIGKNIVAVLLENYGFRVIDLGKDVPAEKILDRAETENADIIGLSALMTTTMPRMQEVVDGVKDRGLTALVMVGGAVLNQEYADKIGADAYSEDARAAVITAQRLMQTFLK